MVSKYEITINGKMYVVELDDVSVSPVSVVVNGERKMVEFREVAAVAPVSTPAPAPEPKAEPAPKAGPAPQAVATGQGKAVSAPMPGKVLSIKVRVGDKVATGDVVCTLEAMKMEMPISSTVGGTVQGIHVAVGDTVAYDAPLITVG